MVCGVEGNHHKVGARRLTETPLAFLTDAVKEVVLDFAEETATRPIVWDIGPLPEAYGDVALMRIVMTNDALTSEPLVLFFLRGREFLLARVFTRNQELFAHIIFRHA